MARLKLFDLFVNFFSQFSEKIEVWFPRGKNCIRVRLTSGVELMFTYNGPNHWAVETADSYLENKKGARIM